MSITTQTPPKLIEFRNLVKKFNQTTVLNGLNGEFFGGERIALIGQNGAGKTTLIRCILGEYVYEGELRVLGKDPRTFRKEILKHVGFVPQLPPPLRLTVEELISFISGLTATPEKEFYAIAEALGLKIQDNLKKPFFKLSGGMKQKILISLALGKRPKILIMDEPTANLDPQARKVFLDYLKDFDHQTMMLLSSHRISELQQIVNRVVEMDFGRIVLDEHISTVVGDEVAYRYFVSFFEVNDDLNRLLHVWGFQKNQKPNTFFTVVRGSDSPRLMEELTRFASLIDSFKVDRVKEEQ